eukprot:1161614-Pelagomonas_calceolata.AAC.2
MHQRKGGGVKGAGSADACASKAQNASEERWRRVSKVQDASGKEQEEEACVQVTHRVHQRKGGGVKGTRSGGVCASKAQNASEERWRRVSKVQDASGKEQASAGGSASLLASATVCHDYSDYNGHSAG